ncbi:aminotransferase class I/II-fold pyridoxal phosphate-dependent enzyme [Hamadaea tsunoensis]|uniref:aminotransferase class I/II-fold pyridoxal phosphate-dependent enzyme n=1 Tax=Hamadaea tsunoensis TaxID=53368 RepID=UPI00048A2F08|nr:aminotransferase class I/II-fold pyridoxal phosphate-dependent enzyme [Hamadaea tsunoensis]
MAVQYQITGKSAAAIVGSVEEGVRTGALREGDALPTVRALAEELGVAANTAAAAYQQLRQRGVIETQGRHGTRVRREPPISTFRSQRGLSLPPGVLDLARGEPTLLPDLTEALTYAAAHRTPANYRNGGPLPALLEAARTRLSELPADAAVTVVGGALDGLDRLLDAAVRPGDPVGVEDPGWAASLDLMAARGLTPVPMPVDDEGPTVEGVRAALVKGVKAIVVTTRAQSPTGAAVSAARAADLRRLLRHQDVLVIEDDHAAELAAVPLATLAGTTDRWAFLRSASKPYGPDLRIAVLAGDATTVSRVEGRMRLGSGWVSTVLQHTLLRLWATVDVSEAGREYDRRRDALVTALRDRGLPAMGRTGINIWVPVADETRTLTALRDAGYAVAPGSVYRLAAPPGVRVTIANLETAEVERFADAFAAAAGGAGGRWTV